MNKSDNYIVYIVEMLRKHINKFVGIGGISLVGIGIYQGIQIRDDYQKSNKILPPDGPISGKVFHLPIPIPVNKMIQKSKEKVTEINHKIFELKEKTSELKDKLKEKTNELKVKLKEKVKEKVSNVETDITNITNEVKALRNKIKWDNIVSKIIETSEFIETSDPEIKKGEEKEEMHNI